MENRMDLNTIIDNISTDANNSNRFIQVIKVSDPAPKLVCTPQDCESDAQYNITQDDDGIWVSLTTPDRWLSESIETSLVSTGDDLTELLEDELAELDLDIILQFQHFRSEDKQFTFRSKVPIENVTADTEAAQLVLKCLLAYEACFHELGDMSATDSDAL